ncbi:MAG: glycosyltransferase family 39 protein [Pirellulales bacterium]
MRPLAGAIAITIAVTFVAISSRPILPIDETRYVSVAWEGYVTGDLLVSHKNGETYAHKPPLLFWLINASWWLFGVSEWAARIVAPFAGVLCLPLVRWIAKTLWPEDIDTANFAPCILASFSVWLLFAPLTMFDTLLTLSALVSICGLLHAMSGRAVFGWLVAGIGMGIGILTKGPVIFVHILPVAMLGYWLFRDRKQIASNDSTLFSNSKLNSSRSIELRQWSISHWYLGVLASILVAGSIGLSWAIPSAIAGGKEYGDELLWGQTAGRVATSFSHRHPFYWYVPILPICLLPWLFLGTLWRGIRKIEMDWAIKMLAVWIAGPLLILSLISGKQVHYLMPMFPAFALFFAKALSQVRQSVPARDVAVLAVGTGLIGCLPLAFNSVPKLEELGLAGIVPNLFVPVLILEALAICFVCQRTIHRVVFGLSAFSAASISIIVGAAGINFWGSFSVDGIANYVTESKVPVVWYGEYHAQLNFAGRMKPIDWAMTADELQDWMGNHDGGIVVTRLTGGEDVALWNQFLATQDSQMSSHPTEEQQRLLKSILAQRLEFSALAQPPETKAIYWVRMGLNKKPYVAMCVHSDGNPSHVAGSAEILR